ncbi:MAG: Verru_Chthon cassette protein B [Candidatus Udaeobacter sp.]
MANLGQRPRETVNANPLALTTRFIAALSRAFSARSLGNIKSWGTAPGWHESALSALGTSAVIRLRSTTAREVDHRCGSRAAAFSLIEVVLALGVAAFCLIAVLGLLPVGVQTTRNASSQTAVSNIIATVMSDLRTTPKAATASPEFAITFNAEKTLFFDSSGKASPSLSADSRYRLNVTWNTAPTGLHYAVLKATWPAEVDPATVPPGGSVAIFAAFDRN